MYCDKADAEAPKCKINPATIVVCKSAFDSNCLKNACSAKDGTCAPTPIEDAEQHCDAAGKCAWVVRSQSSGKPQIVPCDDGDGCTTPDLCKGGTCLAGANDVCGCKSNAECVAKDDGNLCNGTLFCNKVKAPAVCELNPATVVTCPSVSDNACHKNECNPANGKCSTVSVNEGGPCDDSSSCTVGEVCQAGQCGGVPNKCSCKSTAECAGQDDGDLCNGVPFCNLQTGVCEQNPATVVVCPTVDDTLCLKNQCNAKTGACALTVVAENQPCNDANPCTTGETCDKGQCSAADGGNTCECQQDGDCGKYDDEDLCNGKMFCNKQIGKCVLNPATVVTCSKSFDSVCMQNQCNQKTGTCGLQPVNQGVPCDDGLPCTKDEACELGKCKTETNVCECQVNADCADKDDGDFCNGSMYCDKSGLPWTCAVNPATVVSCPSVDDTFCLANQCQPKTGKCDQVPVHQGLGCNDGSKCTQEDVCKNGQCNGNAQQCTDGEACTADSCDPVTGCKNLADPKLCSDDNPCTTDSCSPLTGCSHVQAFGACSDGSACTEGDVCKNLVCVGKASTCDDGNACTDDGCDATTGCSHANNTSGCATGQACNPDGQCKAGKCEGLPMPLFMVTFDGLTGAVAALLPRAGGQMLTVASTGLQGKGKADFWLVRTDAFGKLQWQTTVGSAADELAHGAAGTSDDGAGVVGSVAPGPSGGLDGYLVRTGPTGRAQWKQVAGGAGQDELRAVATFGNDDIIAAGRKGVGKGLMWLVRVSSVGTVLWEQTYPGDLGVANAVVALPDGGFALAGSTNALARFTVVRTDAAGKLIWQKTPGLDGSAALSLAVLADGTLIAGGTQAGTPTTARLVRFAQDGTVTWDLLYGGNAAGHVSALVLQPEGTLAVAGTQVADDAKTHAWLLRVDVNGKEIWQRSLGVVPNMDRPALAIGVDGSPWLASVAPGSAPQPQSFQLQRLDAWGYASCAEEGDCAGKKASDCDDKNPCTNDACLALLGCIHTVNTLPCDDGNACTTADTCKEGQCAKGSSGSCEDGNPCTLDECDAKGGCVHMILTSVCSDGDVCTKSDACVGGFCKPGPVDTCDDANACTSDACDKVKGCSHTANSLNCSSGNCTYDDTCVGGFCKSSGKPGTLDTWYGGPFADKAHHVDQVGEDGFVLTGETYESGTADGLVVRTDVAGKQLWQAKVTSGAAGLHDYLNVTVPTPFGYLSAGSTDNCWTRAMLSRIDLNGAVVWTKLYAWPGQNVCGDGNAHRLRVYDMVYGNDGSWAAVGRVHYWPFNAAELKGWIGRWDKDGNMLSSKAHGGGSTVYFGIAPADGSGYFLAGYTTASTAGSNDGWLVRADADGDANWSVKPGGKGDDVLFSVFAAPDGGCYALGRTTSLGAGNQDLWLVRADVGGKVLWEKAYGGVANDAGTDLVVTPGGPLVLGGHTWSKGAGGADATLLGVDPGGNLQWQQVYGNASDDVTGSIVRLKSGGMALATYGTQPKANAQDFHLLVTDAFGHPTCAAAGTCFDKLPTDCDDGNACTADGCEKTSGCSHANLADGTACGVGKGCVVGVCK